MTLRVDPQWSVSQEPHPIGVAPVLPETGCTMCYIHFLQEGECQNEMEGRWVGGVGSGLEDREG